jgi:EH domain-containing protein 3/EH domain-containing protein 1
MPALFGKKKKQEALLNNLENEFIKIQQTYHLAPGDFPNPARFKQNLVHYDFDKFRPYREEVINMAEQVTAVFALKMFHTRPKSSDLTLL